MEENTFVKKRSVAELAGKFSCQIPHMTDHEAKKPVRRRPPRSLQLPVNKDSSQGQDETETGTVSPRKNRNSALIEKLQANLTLSPTGPPPFPKSPGVVKLPMPFSPSSPISPSPISPVVLTPKQDETPASFENPADGSVLKSINKGRARHSIKRRPPSRRHRKSSADEEDTASEVQENATQNGHEGDVFEEPNTTPDTESQPAQEKIEQENGPTDPDKAEEEVENVTSDSKDEKDIEEPDMEAVAELASKTSESTPQEEERKGTESEGTSDEKEKEESVSDDGRVSECSFGS